jgi:hypothetical protein
MYFRLDTFVVRNNSEWERHYLLSSNFYYYTCFDDQQYGCKLTAQEPIEDFSYEEKRKIIESVVIE